jgi:thiol-disulfide isomerase/thioredoxin
MRAVAGLILVVLALAAGCARPAPAEPLEVTHFYLPGCPTCSAMAPKVEELEREFPGRVRAHNLDATAPENEARMRRFGFTSHGIAIESADGVLLWQQSAHRVNIADAQAALRRLLR